MKEKHLTHELTGWRRLAAIFSVAALLVGCGISGQSPSAAPSGTPGSTGTAATPSSDATGTPSETASAGASGTPDASETPGASASPIETATASPEAPVASPSGSLVWANWPAYMQFSRRSGTFPLLDQFQKQTGITVTYLEDINDNSEFFNIIQPDLALGGYTGYDMITPSDWLVERLIRLGYLEPLDYRLLPNFQANADPTYQDPWYDPGNVYSVPWQAGIVGIGYNRALTGRDITSFDDLLDPAFQGEVGMFSEMRDTMCLTILSLGKECTEATLEDAAAARDKLVEAADRGQFAAFYGNDYYDALARGDIALTMAWSGDVTQMKLYDNPDVQFVIPETGGLLFVDNMVIPKGTQAYADAHLMMDYWYNVDVATAHTEWVGYFSPVAGVPERVLQDAETARTEGDLEWATQLEEISRTAFPTEEELAQVHQYKILTEAEETTWNNLFNEVVFE